MTDTPEPNPYRAPETSSVIARAATRVPGWLVMFFGLVGMMLWGIDSTSGGDLEDVFGLSNTINAILYGVPGAFAGLFFGIGNLTAGRHRVTSLLGVLLALVAVAGGAWKIYGMID